jgi:hypothetical protein
VENISERDSHYTIENLDTLLRIKIRTPRPWIRIGLTAILLLFWTFFEIKVVIPLLLAWFGSIPASITPYRLLLSAFFVYLTFGGVWVGYLFFRFSFGREVIEVSSQSITRRNQILFVTWSREYPGDEIYDLQVSPIVYSQEYRPWPRAQIWWDKGDGPITFDCKGKTIRMGNYLDNAEAQDIVNEIRKRYPQYFE